MKKIKINQVDAFTDKIFGGNPAAVVLDAKALTVEEMKKIAREMNLSETAFVLNSKKGDFKLRYFTPEKEVKFCGHATVGTLYSLARERMFGLSPGTHLSFKVETGAGIIDMGVDFKKDGDITIEFDAPKIDLTRAKLTCEQVAKALGISIDILDCEKPVMREKTNDFIYLTVKSLRDLGNIKYDYERAREFANKENIVVFCLLTTETLKKKNHVHSRVFGPAIGLVEDPVTGATQGALAAYLDLNNMLTKKVDFIRSEQGDFVKRPGQLKIKLHKDKGKYKARILASARHVFLTEILL